MKKFVPFIALLRPHQWIKNVFLFAPIAFTPLAVSEDNLLKMAVGFALFCLIASSIYVFNDITDRDLDRLHSLKKNRPIASGAVSVQAACMIILGLCAFVFPSAFFLGLEFLSVVVFYFILNITYSLLLKRFAIVDVMAIMLGFLLRIMAGSVLIGFPPGVWILLCTGLLAMFLALAKRRDDLVGSLGVDHRASLKAYNLPFLDSALTIVLSTLLASYVIYTTDNDTIEKLGTDKLYMTIPFVIGGLLRYLQLTLVHERSGSPTNVVLSDNPLRFVILGWGLSVLYLIYG